MVSLNLNTCNVSTERALNCAKSIGKIAVGTVQLTAALGAISLIGSMTSCLVKAGLSHFTDFKAEAANLCTIAFEKVALNDSERERLVEGIGINLAESSTFLYCSRNKVTEHLQYAPYVLGGLFLVGLVANAANYYFSKSQLAPNMETFPKVKEEPMNTA